jgi:transcriptional regulator with GAF, ATPase, and Fis domain/tetratricopeptide (TPR) repeat protein
MKSSRDATESNPSLNEEDLRVGFVGLALAAPLSIIDRVPERSARAFVDFDERIVSAQPGVVIVRAPIDVHGPLIAHAARRLRTAGFLPVDAAVRPGAPLFREIASQLGVTVSCEPCACADLINQAAAARRAAIIVPLPKDGTWDSIVANELARAAQRILIVFVSTVSSPSSLGGDTLKAIEATTFDVTGDVDPSDKLRWLSAIAEEAQTDLPTSDLRALEAWWAKARRVAPDPTPTTDGLDDEARSTLTCIALAGRSIESAKLPARALDTLVDAGLIIRCSSGERGPRTLVALSSHRDLRGLEAMLDAGATAEERRRAASLLINNDYDDAHAHAHDEPGSGFDPDPWAFARAAELLLGARAFEEADTAIAHAGRAADGGQAGGEIATRWFSVVAPVAGEGGLMLRLRAAQRSLAIGEAADALRWCESAAALSPEDASIGVLMGRALMQLGDLVAARVTLQKAEAGATAANDQALRSRAISELAEVSYLAGDLATAEKQATRAITLATTVAQRLAGRSTLGKIHLAEGRWDAADEHFAEDALEASSAGEVTAELRARLNRGIALMSKGLLDEARTILERVHGDASHVGEDRACAYALSNLGVVAYRQHDYGSALSFWERTIKFPQALRGRMATALTIANLAELRLRLGLVEHADHAIAFGRKLLSGSAPPGRSAHFKWVAAQVSLARRNTDAARREIESAILDAQASRDREYLDIASIVAARIALDDGDLARSAQAIAQADSVAASPRARAEVAILRALHLRASGQNALEAASHALALARAAGEEDLLAEIHALLANVHRDAGDLGNARAHCGRALAVRDQVAGGLPVDIRAAFLAKPEIVALSRLQTSLAHEVDGEEEAAPRSPRSPEISDQGKQREIVGDDPQIRTLLVAIKKVARANSTVLIRGESGTGKELVAEALHQASDRATGPLVSVNCAALVETLLLSELFGHEKGAFTGASARRRGRFELAEGGTLFLDEIGDISARTQVALLRVLQEKTFERVGGTTPIRANVRVICATHRDLRAMVERGEFREDLYYRLRGITLEVPALRARLGDLPRIADHLLQRIANERGESAKTLSTDAIELLCRHRWPGNIRELENVLRAVSLFADGEAITATDLIENVDDLRSIAQAGPAPQSQPPISLRAGLLPAPPPSFSDAIRSGPISIASSDGDDDEVSVGELPEDEANATAVAYAQVRQGAVSLSDIKRQIERDCIARALLETKGNITRAAALLGMKRPRLSQLVKQYGLSASSSEGNQ